MDGGGHMPACEDARLPMGKFALHPSPVHFRVGGTLVPKVPKVEAPLSLPVDGGKAPFILHRQGKGTRGPPFDPFAHGPQ